MPIEKSAGAVIFRQENKKIYYLLLHYEAGHWDFPKGNIERGEKLEETARREIFEETGIDDVRFVSGFKETIKYFYNPAYINKSIGISRFSSEARGSYKREKKTILKFVTFFLAKTKIKKVKISWEHKGFQWLPYEEALSQLTFKNAKEILKKANKFLTSK